MQVGDWNQLYRIDGNAWVLRVSHSRKDVRQLNFELDVVSSLAKSLALVPDVVPALDGSLFVTHCGRLCTMFAYVPGESPRLSDKVAEAAGETLGVIHRALRGLTGRFRCVLPPSLVVIDWMDTCFYKGEGFDIEALGAASRTSNHTCQAICRTASNSSGHSGIVSSAGWRAKYTTGSSMNA